MKFTRIICLILCILLTPTLSLAGSTVTQEALNEIIKIPNVAKVAQPGIGSLWVIVTDYIPTNKVCQILRNHNIQCVAHILDANYAIAGKFKEIDKCDSY